MNAVKNALRRYADFQGRSRPSDYWIFTLFVLAGAILLAIAEAGLGIGSGSRETLSSPGNISVYATHTAGWLVGFFMLAMLTPWLAVAVRRLHDTDRSGWWLLILFVPLIGQIILFVFLVTGGTRGPNRFGPDPVEEAN